MRISVFGIGYVGAVSAACLARDGHTVCAVDPNPTKVDELNNCISPIVEEGLGELIEGGVKSGRLTATTDARRAIAESDLSYICVGTPSAGNGSLDTSYLTAVSEELGGILRSKDSFHSVVYRSTMLPGTMNGTIVPTIERASNLKGGKDFGVAYYPEFLRESTAIKDYDDPDVIVFGGNDDTTLERLLDIHSDINVAPTIVNFETAEAVKYTNNSWHALKISFANEIGNIAKAAGIDGHEIMSILCQDTRLNISAAYLKPGFAFGGSCLPKDLRALRYKARMMDVPTPILDATLEANDVQLDKAYSLVRRSGSRHVGVVGLSFKPGTDDLRESPLVELVERLHGRGFDIKIYDPNIQLDRLTGANLHYVRSRLPHIASMLTTNLDDVLDHSKVLVFGNAKVGREVVHLVAEDVTMVDLVRVGTGMRSSEQYHGICW